MSTIKTGKASQMVPILLGAKGKFTVRATGTHFFVVESPVVLLIKMDTTSACHYGAGCGLETANGEIFEFLEVENLTDAPVNALIYVGYADYKDTRHTILDQATETTAVDLVNGLLPPNALIALPGIPSGRRSQRRAVYVSNADPTTLSLELLDAAGVRLVLVFPGTSVVVPTSGPVSVRNPHPTAIYAAIGETWYVTSR